MKSPAVQGAIKGLRRAFVPALVAAACFAGSFWATDDMVGLLRGVGWLLVALSVTFVVVNFWNGRSNQETLDFQHGGYDSPPRHADQDLTS